MLDPHFSVMDVGTGWAEGLRDCGIEVHEFNLGRGLDLYGMFEITSPTRGRLPAFNNKATWEMVMKDLYADCYGFWPDVVLIISGFMVSGDVIANLQKRGHKVVLLGTESPYEDITQIERAAQPDMVIVNDPTNLERFQAANPACYYQPHCYRPGVHRPGPVVERLVSDFAFVGTGYPSRVQFLEGVDWTGIDVLLGGYWRNLDPMTAETAPMGDDRYVVTEVSPLREFLGHDLLECVDNLETVDIYRSTKLSANLYRREAERDELVEGWAMGPREVELAATGCMFVTQPRGENREVLPMIPSFDTPGELEDLIRYYIKNEKEREAIATQARAAIEDRTFTNAAQRMLTRLDSSAVVAGVN